MNTVKAPNSRFPYSRLRYSRLKKLGLVSCIREYTFRYSRIQVLFIYGTANVVEDAYGIGRDGFEQIESSDIQELFESQDEDLTETDLEVMLNPHSIEEEPSTSTENASLNRKT